MEQPIEEIIGKILKEKNLTLSTAESCTGGSLASRITSIPGCSAYYKGGVVCYANEIKRSILGVNHETLENHGAVSEITAIEMVTGSMKTFNTDCAMATTGIAGPGGGTPNKPVGTVWIAVANKNVIKTICLKEDHGREKNVEKAVHYSLTMLYELIK